MLKWQSKSLRWCSLKLKKLRAEIMAPPKRLLAAEQARYFRPAPKLL
jgi:hypothetical protein